MTTPLTTGKGYVLAAAEDGAPAPTLYLYDVLGMDMFGGIAARQIVDDLQALGQIDALNVRINSAGGDVFEGIAVYNALKRFPAKVTVHIDGIAASIASLIAMAGDKTLIAENAMVMVHRPWTAVMGDAEEMRRVAETLDKAWSAMLTTYQRRTGRRAATIAQHVSDAGGEWWLTAEEAVAAGFADEVVKAEKQAQVFGLHRFRKVPAQLAASGADAAGAHVPVAPRVASIEAPRVEVPPRESTPRSVRRRVVDLLRLGS
jgi:ATP-dependent Clp protease protease subunit